MPSLVVVVLEVKGSGGPVRGAGAALPMVFLSAFVRAWARVSTNCSLCSNTKHQEIGGVRQVM